MIQFFILQTAVEKTAATRDTSYETLNKLLKKSDAMQQVRHFQLTATIKIQNDTVAVLFDWRR